MHILNASQEQFYRLQCVCLLSLCLFVCLFPFLAGKTCPLQKSYNMYLTKLLWHCCPHMGYLWRTRESMPLPLPSIQRGAICFAVLTIATCTGSLNIHMFKVCRYKHWDIGDMFWPHDILWILKLKSKYLEEKPLCLVAMAANFLDLNQPYGRNRHMVRTIFRQT